MPKQQSKQQAPRRSAPKRRPRNAATVNVGGYQLSHGTDGTSIRGSFLGAPTSVGYSAGRYSFWRQSGTPAPADCDMLGSARYSISMILPAGYNAVQGKTGVPTPPYGALGNAAAANYRPLDPFTVGDRFVQVADMYDQYAIRKLAMRYIPQSKTSYQGDISWGLWQDVPQTSGPQLNMNYATVRDLPRSTAHSVWMTGKVDYDYSGRRTWYTFDDSGATSSALRFTEQLQLVACFSGDLANDAVNTIGYGYFEFDAIVDMYQPLVVTALPRLSRQVRLHQRDLALRSAGCGSEDRDLLARQAYHLQQYGALLHRELALSVKRDQGRKAQETDNVAILLLQKHGSTLEAGEPLSPLSAPSVDERKHLDLTRQVVTDFRPDRVLRVTEPGSSVVAAVANAVAGVSSQHTGRVR